MTYALISLAFLAVALVVLAIALATRRDRVDLMRRWWLPALVSGALLAVLTAVFDNVMIGVGLMTYSGATTSGLRVGLVPVEDFAYPLAALVLLPALWLLTGRRRRRRRRDGGAG
ncbi:lycopene cyclase domain-containing protein [Leifsonia sp. NPDC080035]|uniref:Lycopene cyclase domain-containing protein n=1 Tax=Leifsonia sp. NPDC080035 TaxID=3143936 RepID=A0AAU7GBC9_9MICO